MKYNPEKHHRRSIRLQGYDYSQPGAYFITICTKDRKYLFGNIIDGKMVLNEYGKIAQQCWLDIPLHYQNVELNEFVVMPNHVHGIIIININDTVGTIHELPLHELPLHELPLQKQQRRLMTLPKIIGRFKMNSAKQINQLRQTPGIPLWQRNYYEHIIRNKHELNRIKEYIINNG
jgi:REP element-mobilizing transposase RayT